MELNKQEWTYQQFHDARLRQSIKYPLKRKLTKASHHRKVAGAQDVGEQCLCMIFVCTIRTHSSQAWFAYYFQPGWSLQESNSNAHRRGCLESFSKKTWAPVNILINKKKNTQQMCSTGYRCVTSASNILFGNLFDTCSIVLEHATKF